MRNKDMFGGYGMGVLWDCWGEWGLEGKRVIEINVRVRTIQLRLIV